MRYVRPSNLLAGFHAEAPDEAVPELVHIGEQWAPSAYLIPEHAHTVWEFYLQVDGESRWISWELPRKPRRYVLKPGDFFAVPPGVRHALAERPRDRHHFFFAAIDLQVVFGRCGDLEPFWKCRDCLCRRQAQALLGPFRQVVREVSAKLPLRSQALRAAIEYLVIQVSRLRIETSADPKNNRPSQRRSLASPQHVLPLHPAVQVVRDLLDQQFSEPWQLADLGRLAGFSPNHLAQLFTREVGITPHQYLLRERIERAREMLASTDVPVTRLALDLGFSSSQHFARVFHSNTRQSARAFRLQAQQRSSHVIRDKT